MLRPFSVFSSTHDQLPSFLLALRNSPHVLTIMCSQYLGKEPFQHSFLPSYAFQGTKAWHSQLNMWKKVIIKALSYMPHPMYQVKTI
jgi:hypothetical protein